MLLLGYILAVLVGISLGITGSGGAILTVPLLVYMFSLSPSLATSYSLFIVGATSFVGSLNNLYNKAVDIKTVFSFGVFSTTAVYFVRRFLIPYIPEKVVETDGGAITYSALTMILLSCFMITSALSLIHIKERLDRPDLNKLQLFKRLMISGLTVGSITGFLGIGGGFLLVPSLVYLIKLPVRKAIGTSLCIITINSLVGFYSTTNNEPINWGIVLSIACISILGLWIGSFYVKKVPLCQLKKAVGWFILIIGMSIIIKEIWTQCF